MAINQQQYSQIVAANNKAGVSTPTINVLNGIGLPSTPPSNQTQPGAVNTGTVQNPGTTTINGVLQTSPYLAGNYLTNQIPADTLNPNNPMNSKITFPANTGTINYNGLNTALSTTNPDGTPKSLDTQNNDVYNQQQNQFQTYLDNLQSPPSSADAYNRAQKETGLIEKQQTVNDLTAKLNMITATGEANKQMVVGQGRGIPETIIGGQQAEMARETAIQALPVSAQLNAAQNNLQTAQQNVDTLFKIYSDDANNQYAYKNKINEAIYAFVDRQDKARLEEIQKQEDRNYSEKQDNIQYARSLSATAISKGQGTLAGQIMALDPKDKDYQTKLGQLASQIKAKERGTTIKSGNLVISEGDVSKNQQALESSRGKDTYANTKIYTDMFDEWVTQHNGLASDFFKYFPPTNYINPNDPTVPQQIKRALKKSSSSTSSSSTSNSEFDFNNL